MSSSPSLPNFTAVRSTGGVPDERSGKGHHPLITKNIADVLHLGRTSVNPADTAVDVDVVLDQITAAAHCATVHYLWRPCLRDPGDDLVLEGAVNGGTDVVATFNVKDFRVAVDRFAVRFLRPAEVWAMVRV